MSDEDRKYLAWEKSQVESSLSEAMAHATPDQVSEAILNIFSDADIAAIVQRIGISRRNPIP